MRLNYGYIGPLVAQLCCIMCLLKCVESCVQWVTGYAYVYVALYGTSFISGGKEVIELLGAKGEP